MKIEPDGTVPLLWSKVIWRTWRSAPKVPAVLVAILAIGVAVFLSVRLANRAAVTGFTLFTESVSGDSDLLVRPLAGKFADAHLDSLREAMGKVPASIFPVLESTASAGTEADASIFRIVGVDFVSLPNAAFLSDEKASSPISGSDPGFSETLGRSDRVYISDALARKNNLDTGDNLTLFLEGDERIITVAGILKDDGIGPGIPENLLLLDLPGAQDLTGNPGNLSRLEIRIPPGPDFTFNLREARAILEKWAGENFVVETPAEKKRSTTQMSAAFRLNLTILSTLALVVGAYLILQAMEASVIKRRSEISILRCLGVTPRQIHGAWLAESLVLGLLGSVLGILLGLALAQGMVRAIASTVNTLYYETTSSSAALDWGEAGRALLFGMVISVFAGWLPAREAASVPPALGVSTGIRGGGLEILRWKWLGVLLTLTALGFSFLPPYPGPGSSVIPAGGYAAALFFLLGMSILAGSLFSPLSSLLDLGKASPLRRYAASQFRLPEGRHRLAAAGLLAAFGMSAAMGILVASFEGTLTAWIRQMLKADVYIAAAGSESAASDHKIPEEVWRSVTETEGVDGFDRIRVYPVTLEGKEAWLGGSSYNRAGRRLQLIWLAPPGDMSAGALNKAGEGFVPAWISEGFSRRFGKARGDEFDMPTPSGKRRVRVTGIYADYGSERGTIIVSHDFTSRWFDDASVSNLAIYLEPGVDDEKWVARFREDHPGLVARTNRKLRGDALRLFRQTFSVTYALEGIAVFIAVAGLGLAMAGLLMERSEELRTLKELGLTRRQIAGAAMWEGLGLSLVGAAGGIVLSLILGILLVFVINRQSFGWTLDLRIPWLSILGLTAAILSTGALVAWCVGYRIANLRSDLKEE